MLIITKLTYKENPLKIKLHHTFEASKLCKLMTVKEFGCTLKQNFFLHIFPYSYKTLGWGLKCYVLLQNADNDTKLN